MIIEIIGLQSMNLQCCCQGLEVRGQGQGQGLKQRKAYQCLECKFTTSHTYVLFINISDLDTTPYTSIHKAVIMKTQDQ